MNHPLVRLCALATRACMGYVPLAGMALVCLMLTARGVVSPTFALVGTVLGIAAEGGTLFLMLEIGDKPVADAARVAYLSGTCVATGMLAAILTAAGGGDPGLACAVGYGVGLTAAVVLAVGARVVWTDLVRDDFSPIFAQIKRRR